MTSAHQHPTASATPAGVLAVADAERAILETQLDEARADLVSLRAGHAEEIAAWLTGRAAAAALYARRVEEARGALAAGEERRRAVEAELEGAPGSPGDMRRARLGELLASSVRQLEGLRARIAQLSAVHERIARGDVG